MRTVSALNMLSRTAWTSRSEMLVSARSASVTPENLGWAELGPEGSEGGFRAAQAGGGEWGGAAGPHLVL